MSFSDMMKHYGIARIVFMPADEMVRYDRFHAWPFDGWLEQHCGRGATVEEAIADAVDRRTLYPREAA